MHTQKYDNCSSWLAPVRLYDADFAEAVQKVHYAICMADDIADRAIHPKEAPELLWLAVQGISGILNLTYAQKIKDVLERIFKSEVANLCFVPGMMSLKEDFEIWETRASLLDLYFEAWVCVDSSIDTIENRQWFKGFKKRVLILDDCADILTGSFEDLIQCRRNYVVLSEYGYDGYMNWKDNKGKIIKAAEKIKLEVSFEDPKDQRLKIFMR